MTNKENIKKTISKDFDKNNNHNVIIDKILSKHNNKFYFKYAAIPVILVIFLLVILVEMQNSNKARQFKDVNNVNAASNSQNSESNINESVSIIVNELKEYKNKQEDSSNYLNNINIPYFEVLNELKVPEDFDILFNGFGISVLKDVNNKDYGKINNYEFWFKNSKNNRRIIIALSDKNIPYRSFQINENNIKTTIINSVEVKIFKYENTYVSLFSYKGYNFDIETSDITYEEYASLLYSLIK